MVTEELAAMTDPISDEFSTPDSITTLPPSMNCPRYSQDRLSLEEKTAQTASVVEFPQRLFGNWTFPTSKLLWPNPARKSASAVQFNQKRRQITAGRLQTVHFVPQTNFVTARL
jgi:hypothetical protein